MSKLKEINRQATFAWSPLVDKPNLMAVSTVAGTIGLDFDTSSKLEIFSLDITNPSNQMTLKGSINSPNRFHKLLWLPTTQSESGLIVGGLENGSIGIWNPSKLMDGENNEGAFIGSGQKHSGGVQAMDYCLQQPNLIATGGPDAEIFIWDLSNPSSPSAYNPGSKPNQSSECTSISWNKKVQHIIASSLYNGNTIVWDLKSKKSIITFSDKTRKCKTRSLLWSPSESTQIVTASEDDDYPVIQTWDLRNTNSPLKTLEGHRRGIWGLSWCPSDTSLLLSVGKDNRTLCWNIDRGEVLCEVESSTDPNQWNFDVQWSPRIPAIFATGSFGGNINVYSMQDVNARNVAPQVNALGVVEGSPVSTSGYKHTPSWLQRPVGASFGFGGKLAVFGRKKQVVTSPQQSGQQAQQAQQQQQQLAIQQQRVVRINKIVTEKEFLERSDRLEQVMNTGDFDQFCQEKIQSAQSDDEKATWSFLKVSFNKNHGKQTLLNYLGYDIETTKEELQKFLQTLPQLKLSEAANNTTTTSEEQTDKQQENGEDNNKELSNIFKSSTGEFPIGGLNGTEEQNSQPVSVFNGKPLSFPSSGDENMIAKAVLLGDFATAVECCLRLNRMADALVLAHCGGQDLYLKTMQAYFDANDSNSFSRFVSCIARNDLVTLVRVANLQDWKSVLAVLCMYGATNAFQPLTSSLGDRLINETNDAKSATLCYICSGDIEKTVSIWTNGTSVSKGSENGDNEKSHKELLDLIEKVSILRSASGVTTTTNLLAGKYSTYAELLASQGNLSGSLRYLSLLSDQQQNDHSVLLDRVYGASVNTQGIRKPAFPFNHVEVGGAGQRVVPKPGFNQPPSSGQYQQPSVPVNVGGVRPNSSNPYAQPSNINQPPMVNPYTAQPPVTHTAVPPPTTHTHVPPPTTSAVPYGNQPPVVHSHVAPPTTFATSSPIQPPTTHTHSHVPPPITGQFSHPPPSTHTHSLPPTTFATSSPVPPPTTSNINYNPTTPVNPTYGMPPVVASVPTAQPPPPQQVHVPPPPITSSNIPHSHSHESNTSSSILTPPPKANVHNTPPVHSPHLTSSAADNQQVSRMIDSLNSLITSLSQRGANQQKIEDAKKRSQVLIYKLQKNELSANALSALEQVIQFAVEGDFKTASDKYLSITSTSYWNEIGSSSMVGLKRVIDSGIELQKK